MGRRGATEARGHTLSRQVCQQLSASSPNQGYGQRKVQTNPEMLAYMMSMITEVISNQVGGIVERDMAEDRIRVGSNVNMESNQKSKVIG